MSARVRCLLVAAAAAALSGCRTTHLGADTGAAYRDALDEQRDSGPEGPAFDADAARAALAARRRAPARGRADRAVTTLVPIASPVATGDAGGAGPITLEAK